VAEWELNIYYLDLVAFGSLRWGTPTDLALNKPKQTDQIIRQILGCFGISRWRCPDLKTFISLLRCDSPSPQVGTVPYSPGSSLHS
jgi:hypothetical protein